MANRRCPLDSSMRPPFVVSRALSFGFLLLLCSCCLLSSISCASFEDRHQLRKRHHHTSADDEVDLIDQWAPGPISQISYSTFEADQPQQQQQQRQRQSASGYYSPQSLAPPPPPPPPRPLHNNNRDLAANNWQSYSRILLAPERNQRDDSDDLSFAPTAFRPSSAARATSYKPAQYQLVDGDPVNNIVNSEYQLVDSLNNNPADVYTISSGPDRQKLLELLAAGGDADDDGNNINNGQPVKSRQLSEEYQFLLEPNAKQQQQQISFYPNLDSESIGDTDGSPPSAINGDNAQLESSGLTGNNFANKYVATTGDQSSKRSELPAVQAASRAENEHKNLTTLLDDDDDIGLQVAKSDARGNDDKTIGTEDPAAATTEVSYGKVVAKAADRQQQPHSSEGQSNGDASHPHGLSRFTSMLGDLYRLVADKWPAALSVSSAASSKKIVAPANSTTQLVNGAKSANAGQAATMTTSEGGEEEKTITKPSVSELTTTKPEQANSSSSSSNDDQSMSGENNDKRTIVIGGGAGDQFEQTKNVDLAESSERSIRIDTNQLAASSEGGGSDASEHQQAAATRFESTSKREDKQSIGHKISLLRQSSLSMPYKSNDDELIGGGGGGASSSSSLRQSQLAPAASLVEKYIYAPEHHYHLSSSSSFRGVGADSKRVSIGGGGDDDNASSSTNDDRQMFAKMSHRSFPRNTIHPGDEVYAGSYSSLRPIFAAHHLGDDRSERLGLISNKSNDIYFLVMVAAFCAMAMAVVLAAGLFAYRVQHNRKSSTEADYPTYGVVGPNNMNGKTGPASFVGGYFTGMGGPGSSSSGSKAGSVKHLADMYSIGADSGISTNGGGGGGCKTSSASKRAAAAAAAAMANDQAASNAANASGNIGGPAGQGRFANQNAARMFHYQHQKQQMIISDRSSNGGRHTSASDLDSEDENDEGSYTVYECPGLASAHEMEIKNPLFNDDQTP